MEASNPAHSLSTTDAAAMNLNKMLEMEDPAGAADFAERRHRRGEAPKMPDWVGARDANAGVGDREGHFGAVCGSADDNLAPGDVLHGVVEEILQDFGEAAAIGGDVRIGCCRFTECADFFRRRGARFQCNSSTNCENARRANLEFQAVGIHFGELTCRREPCEAPGVFEEMSRESGDDFAGRPGPRQEAFPPKPWMAVKRRFEFVAKRWRRNRVRTRSSLRSSVCRATR